MKNLFLLMFAAVFAGCVTDTTQITGPKVGDLTTAQLQERRLELYKLVPRSAQRLSASPDVRGGSNASNNYVTEYHTFGGPLPQQDEIVQIERELDRRRTRGDKAAYFEQDAPHVPPTAQQSGGPST